MANYEITAPNGKRYRVTGRVARGGHEGFAGNCHPLAMNSPRAGLTRHLLLCLT